MRNYDAAADLDRRNEITLANIDAKLDFAAKIMAEILTYNRTGDKLYEALWKRLETEIQALRNQRHKLLDKTLIR